MTDEQLKSVLGRIDISECEEIIENYIYYIKMPVRQRCSCSGGGYSYYTNKYEFLVIAENGVKQAIILRCDDIDLHWHVLKKWRGQHVLSNALRTGVIGEVWPENTKVTCCYNYDDNREEKYSMTKHLADIAGLILE